MMLCRHPMPYSHQISRHAQVGPHSHSCLKGSTCMANRLQSNPSTSAHRRRSRSPPVLLAPRHPSSQQQDDRSHGKLQLITGHFALESASIAPAIRRRHSSNFLVSLLSDLSNSITFTSRPSHKS
ncbi:hypothetical protein BDZ85DRAFT_260603 [Elsinoe ampelina]|uniref:Uncharacterized protein n=1 Tax=Elsinoe ampelina TaxID=302913 RepID=A0A6A6GEZ1_9PEZI|nr:hypothetical protein BDZ85DRAFT_260603 [Elsinoe ampelina]